MTFRAGNESAYGVVEGSVTCEACLREFRLRDGILDLLQKEGDPFAAVEIAARDREASEYEQRFAPARNATEIPSTLRGLDLRDKVLLDLGCGTGRVTIRAGRYARLTLGIDYSVESLRYLASRLRPPLAGRIGLVLGDASKLHFNPRAFDIALSTQVIEHVRSTTSRLLLLREVANSLRKDGVFVYTIYHYSLLHRVLGLRREGKHPNGIYYRRFSATEARREAQEAFSEVAVLPIQIQAPLLTRSPSASELVSSFLERVPLARSAAHLLRVTARSPRRSDG
jgi:SAM-dependent methyltransferase